MRLCYTHVMRLVSVSLFALLFPKFFSFEYVPRSLIMMSKYAVSFSDSFTVIIGVYLRINIHIRYTPIRMKSFQYYFLGSNCCRLFEISVAMVLLFSFSLAKNAQHLARISLGLKANL